MRLESARRARFDVMRTHKEDFLSHRLPATRRRYCEFLGEQPRRVPAELRRYFEEAYG